MAVFFMIFSPRIFGDSFFNVKDLILLSFYWIAFYYILKSNREHSIKYTLLAAFLSAITINIRLIGISIIFIYIFDYICTTKFSDPRKFFIYFIVTAITTVVCWARLWSNPLINFVEAFTLLANFAWDGDILFLHRIVRASALPWSYIPVWILVTTPIYILVFFMIGFFRVVLKVGTWQIGSIYYEIIFILIILGSILPVIFLHSIVYDGWRHLYYIYPAIILTAISGYSFLRGVIGFTSLKKPLIYLLNFYVFISLIFTAIWMWKSHPHQNIYFNFMAGKNAGDNFDLDYWGLSNKQAIELISKSSNSSFIKISVAPGKYAYVNYLSLIYNLKFLPRKVSDRFFPIEAGNINDADYVIQSFRGGDYIEPNSSHFNFFDAIYIDGQAILKIYENKSHNRKRPPSSSVPTAAYSFTTEGNGRKMLLDIGGAEIVGGGWSLPESWGTWSDGLYSKVLIPLPKKFTKLRINLIPYLSSGQVSRRVMVYINDSEYGLIELKSGDNTFTIDSSQVSPGEKYIIVKFIYLDKKELHKKKISSSEPRNLSMAITTATFD